MLLHSEKRDDKGASTVNKEDSVAQDIVATALTEKNDNKRASTINKAGSVAGASVTVERDSYQDNVQMEFLQKATECIVQEQAEITMKEQQREIGDLGQTVTKLYVPVYARDPKLKMFQDLKGVEYDGVESAFGTFLCIPHADMAEFDEYKRVLMERICS